MKATIDTLGDSIALVLEDCVRQANKANDETLDQISKEALKVVKENAPARENGGIYKKGLKRKKTKDERDELQYTLYAGGKESSLSHLVENGHLTRNGESTVPGKPHFAKGQEYAAKEIEAVFIKNYRKESE
ncbi:HK97 gp10 family phage protein [Allobaculum mucilyticum]|uniref:HK97 gp10 family phage protein n=2 Tax=Allobaculum mucilyticum TaxID=2834459 RepID=UPI001F61B710|nr:HK97 gp10 family phage protein [Allobaculum mucilyticum]UNT96728.1 hypothetical protein KWG62_02930 [Allobaculum mucilyticum]